MRGLREKLNTIGNNIDDKDFFEEFGIIKSRKGDLTFLNYDQEGIKPNRYSNLCRGTIFRGKELVLLPFIRFFNLHEPDAANVDWRYADVLEKLDGTVMSAWFDDKEGRWRLSSRRMVDEIPIWWFGRYEMFNAAATFKEFFPSYENMDRSYWYIFELIYSRIVTYYPKSRYGLYTLAIRNKRSLDELNQGRIKDIVRGINEPMVKLPELYDIRNKETVLRMFKGKPEDFEGVVVVDNNFNRIKIKQKSYLRLHYLIDKASSPRKIIDIILNNEQSEFLSYFPDMRDKFNEAEKRLNMLKIEAMTAFGMYNHIQSRREFAAKVKNLSLSHLIFKLRDGYELTSLFRQMGGEKLVRYIQW